jgi:hypothetical protein
MSDKAIDINEIKVDGLPVREWARKQAPRRLCDTPCGDLMAPCKLPSSHIGAHDPRTQPDPAPREATEEELRAQRAGYVRAEMAFGTDRQEAQERREATEEAPQRKPTSLERARAWLDCHVAITVADDIACWMARFLNDCILEDAAPPSATESLYRVPITRLLVPSAVDEATEGFNAIFPWVPQAEDENGNLLTLADKIEILGKQYDDLLDVKPATESELRSQPEPTNSLGTKDWIAFQSAAPLPGPAAITALKEIVELVRLADDISVCNDIAEIAEKAIAESPTGQPQKDADEEYEFDRLRNGVLMAEGVRVHAPTLNEAICKAKGLFHPWDQRDTLQLRKDV